MLETKKIVLMENEEIVKMLSDKEYEIAMDIFKTEGNFVDNYQEAARLSDEEMFLTPGEYVELKDEMR